MARAIETVHARVDGVDLTIEWGSVWDDRHPVVVAFPQWFEDIAKPAPKKAAAPKKGE